MSRYVAFIRGINVGTINRVPMSELRKLLYALGYREIRILPNSGNVTFSTSSDVRYIAKRIENGLIVRFGVRTGVIILSAQELNDIVENNPLEKVATNPQRFFVAILKNPRDRHRLHHLTERAWTPEILDVGKRVAYLWCPGGVLASTLAKSVGESLGDTDAMTTRTWRIILKLHALNQK